MLSGLFESEMAPGAGAQTFYSFKPARADDVLTSAQLATRMEAERLAAEVKAQADDEDDATAASSPVMKAVVWIVVIVAVAGLGFACSGSNDDGTSSGSVRSSFHGGGGHGGN